MKKIMSLLLSVTILLSAMCTVFAEVNTMYDLSVDIPEGFVKSYEDETTVNFKDQYTDTDVLSVQYVKDFFKGLLVENISQVERQYVEEMANSVASKSNIEEILNTETGEEYIVNINEKYLELGNSINGVPMYISSTYAQAFSEADEEKYYSFDLLLLITFVANGDDLYIINSPVTGVNEEISNKFYQAINSISVTEKAPSKEETPEEAPEVSPIKIKLNGEYVVCDSDPVIVNDRTLVPIRAVAEKLGYDVLWEAETRTAIVKNNDVSLRVTIDAYEMVKETKQEVDFVPEFYTQEKIELDVAAQIINDRTYLPLRAVGEALGCDVDWDADTRTVIIEEK